MPNTGAGAEEPTLTAPGGAHVVVTLESIYALTLETRDTSRELKKSVSDLVDDYKDHEGRLRSLERKVWIAAGIAAGTGAGISQFISSLGA